MKTNKLFVSFLTLILYLVNLPFVAGQRPQNQISRPTLPDLSLGRGNTGRGAVAADKLSPELRVLAAQFAVGRGGESENRYTFSPTQLLELFGVPPGVENPPIKVTVRLDNSQSKLTFNQNEFKIYFQEGGFVLGEAQARLLLNLAENPLVKSISATGFASFPPLPLPTTQPKFDILTNLAEPRGRGGATNNQTPEPNNISFNRFGLTGKGVIVGVVDSGIDWTHQDFIRPDGTSRILALWDMSDESFRDSGGKIGNQPEKLSGSNTPPPGTVYTNAQINAALQGQGAINSIDEIGHGTAVAGTAAGNGRATANNVPVGTYQGIAPEADLLIVKAGGCEGVTAPYLLGTFWISQLAKKLKRPVVINHSLGSHSTSHNGDSPEEQYLNYLLTNEKHGIIATAAAGNEGELTFHAVSRFGPRRDGQKDVEGQPIEVTISPKRSRTIDLQDTGAFREENLLRQYTFLNAFFRGDEDWGLALQGSGDFLTVGGKPMVVYIYKLSKELVLPNRTLKPGLYLQYDTAVGSAPDYYQSLTDFVISNYKPAETNESYDRLMIPLPPGSFYLWGFGPTANVKQGAARLYIQNEYSGSFTIGAVKERMVGTPGTALKMITVGAYNYRDQWANSEGKFTYYNLPLGDYSSYSSPGGRREEKSVSPTTAPTVVFKPDIVAPGSYTISSLSKFATEKDSCAGHSMGATAKQKGNITPDGFHLAWNGTSAATPFVTGVIALMLQKNPTLNSEQVKKILTATTTTDSFTGGVPNPQWGYGKINPEAALRRTPIARKTKQ
jgi:subtilisin family serine protease